MSGESCDIAGTPDRQAWYAEFCTQLSVQAGDKQVEGVDVGRRLNAFLARRALTLPRRTRDHLVRKTVFELNLPTQVRSRSSSEEATGR